MQSNSLQTPTHGHATTVNDMLMYYKAYGKGLPLGLLHNLKGLVWTASPMLPLFAEQYRLIIPDLQGHGRSTNQAEQFTARQSALDLFALLDQLEIHQFRAIGISFGGLVLLHMATQQPNRVEAMVLIGRRVTLMFAIECDHLIMQPQPILFVAQPHASSPPQGQL